MKCLPGLMLGGILLGATGHPARAEDWPLREFEVNASGTDAPIRFVYVPAGQRFTRLRLLAQVTAGGDGNVLSLYVDGRLVRVLRPVDGVDLEVALPELDVGYHRLEFLGQPTTVTADRQPHTECPVITVFPFALREPRLRYVIEHPAGVRLADLPDGLFNREHPDAPVRGDILVEPGSTAAYSAAARLAGWLDGLGRITWRVGAADPRAAFRILIRWDRDLSAPALIHLRAPRAVSSPAVQGPQPVPEARQAPRQKRWTRRGGRRRWARRKPLMEEPGLPRAEASVVPEPAYALPSAPAAETDPPMLEITYSTDAGLTAAINALLNNDYRRQLLGASAAIPAAVPEPPWAVLTEPRTFADFHLEDIVIRGTAWRDLALEYPLHWQPTGIAQGSLVLRGQAGLPKEAHLNIWLDGDLAGSEILAFLGSGDLQRTVPVTGTRVPGTNLLGLRLEAVLDIARWCELPAGGVLWVDAGRSRIEFPHREKTGILGFVPRLVADPRFTLLSGDAAAATALLALLKTVQPISGGRPLPYAHITRLTPGSTQATLTVGADPVLFRELAAHHAVDLNADYLADAVWLHADSDGRLTLVAPSSETLEAFPAHWMKAPRGLPDGALDAVLNVVDGSLVVLRAEPSALSQPDRRLSDTQFGVGVLMVLLGFTASMAALIVWRRRRRTT